ncbi:MAG: ribonuclease N [Actinomycetota bacterium]|nr:ribonuclease N [Actinomycetota bacterium]
MRCGRSGATLLGVVLALLACLALAACSATDTSTSTSTTGAGSGHHLSSVTPAKLPVQARETIRLILHGGPFPYSRDGAVFGNFERLLPQEPTGYYHEYTVPTPGSADRGARRIIAGKDGQMYYTGDHYQSFSRIEVN